MIQSVACAAAHFGASARLRYAPAPLEVRRVNEFLKNQSGGMSEAARCMAHYTFHAPRFQEKPPSAFDPLRPNRYTHGLRCMPCPDGWMGRAGY
jgi:hypothetical protein